MVNPLVCLVAIPFIAALVMALTSLLTLSKINKKLLAFVLSLLPLGILLFHSAGWQGAVINAPWIPTLGINFHLQMDSISLLFIALTAIIIPLAILTVDHVHISSTRLFYALILLLQGALFILFSARDLALFTISWEAVLLPLYFIILLWGNKDKENTALLFLIYMIAGSALFVAAVLGLYFSAPSPTFNMDQLAATAESAHYAPLFFAILLLAFAVKTPLFPFHAWLPNTYVNAPYAGSILLAALLSKAGIYGIVRLGHGLFPNLMEQYSPYLLTLAVIGTLYAAFAAWSQHNYKRLIAYSSLSHVNFILAGVFLSSQVGLQGALLQAFNHGITITALFLVSAWLERRVHSSEMNAIHGATNYFPKLAWLTLFFVLASIALPGTNNFIGEFIILFALMGQSFWLAAFLALAIIFSACYMLRWMEKVFFGEPFFSNNEIPADIGKKEFAMALPLVALILAIGIFPGPILQQLKAALPEDHQEKLVADADQDKRILEQQLDDEMQRQKVFQNEREDDRWRQEQFQRQQDQNRVLQQQYEQQRVDQDYIDRQYDQRRVQDAYYDNRRQQNQQVQRDLDRRREDDRRRR